MAWVIQDRWDALPPEQKEAFPPIAPDFVLELMSLSDDFTEAQAKMDEYMRSGVRLGWLINHKLRYVWIYRPDADAQGIEHPATLLGEDVLPGFTLNMKTVW